MVRSSPFAAVPLFVLSLTVEDWPAIVNGIEQATLAALIEVLWQTAGNSLFGYAVWNWLLSRYPAASVTPMTLLVPVFGTTTSSLFLGEQFPLWKLGAAVLVIGGLALNVMWPVLRKQRGR